MSERVTMPALGESVTEGTVTRWLKNVGDTVTIDEPLLEVSTDKVDTEIPSPVAGTLQEILVAEDETVPVGTDLAIVGSGVAAPAAAQASAAEPEPEPAPVTPPVQAAPPSPSISTDCAPMRQGAEPGAPVPEGTTTGQRADALGEKLARSDGVLCPPAGVDPEMRAPAPDAGNTPVIPPAGSPSGDPSIRPK